MSARLWPLAERRRHLQAMPLPRIDAATKGHFLSLHIGFMALVIIISLLSNRYWPWRSITVSVDGHHVSVVTQEKRVADVLHAGRIDVRKEDEITPPARKTLGTLTSVNVKRSVPVAVWADGREAIFYTTADTLGQALSQAEVTLRANDRLLRDDTPASPEEAVLPASKGKAFALVGHLAAPLAAKWQGEQEELPPRSAIPARLRIDRAVPVYIVDNGLASTIYTTQPRLMEALEGAGIDIYPGDLVYPSLDEQVGSERRVYITRSKGLSIEVDGGTLEVRTLQKRVQEVLDENGIPLGPMDIVAPPVESRVLDQMAVKITRVNEVVEEHQKAIPHERYRRADPKQEIDTPDRVAQEGQDGLRKWTERVRYENGREVGRVKEREWVEREPVDHVVTYGTGIVIRDLQTPEGPVQYWRKIRVYATWYDARQGGKSRDDPWYGRTALGLEARKGVAAVDPSVIPFWTKMYVPGYGIAVAGDTGGAIKGRWIDLAFGEDEPKTWGTKWTDIYLLTPAPDPSRILLQLPDYP